ncbi:fatty acyl-CoA elongase, putative [Ixodes scapularis]|uniref:Elongation of very long chain fatty acids protein n=2 Tax=Ixodes scapularis TaxID=6945 RepID=B7QN75_IXOSC|nr:fatty acyl-CoA elongase, putative [Ixodes scapularis]|eukprot:XP_002400755.1 fatty acyl-CoA elongase, putative [Ixodes scapularis]
MQEDTRMPTNFSEAWQFLMSKRDPRTADMLFVGDVRFIVVVLGLYLYIVYHGGPKFMKNREPYNLKPAIMTYNFAMVFLNAFFMVKFFQHSFVYGGYSFFCQGMTHATDKHSLILLDYAWWYLFVRIADFLDTFFFILRKKYSHLSALHVSHHGLVVWSGWLWMAFGSDGQPILGLCVNAGMHVIMYTYYFLAALGPKVQKYLWWKKYITTLQITQFVVLLMHICIPLVYDCGYPGVMIAMAFAQGLLGLVLFINFYIHEYMKRKVLKNPVKMLDNMCVTQSQTPAKVSGDRPKKA